MLSLNVLLIMPHLKCIPRRKCFSLAWIGQSSLWCSEQPQYVSYKHGLTILLFRLLTITKKLQPTLIVYSHFTPTVTPTYLLSNNLLHMCNNS